MTFSVKLLRDKNYSNQIRTSITRWWFLFKFIHSRFVHSTHENLLKCYTNPIPQSVSVNKWVYHIFRLSRTGTHSRMATNRLFYIRNTIFHLLTLISAFITVSLFCVCLRDNSVSFGCAVVLFLSTATGPLPFFSSIEFFSNRYMD